MFKTETKLRVRYYETDKMGFVHHSNYARYYECARSEATRSLGYPYSEAEKDGTYMPVLKVESKFIKPLYYEDEFTITTEIRELPRFGIITFHHQFFNEQNELAHQGTITLAMINEKTNKRECGPPKFMEILKTYF